MASLASPLYAVRRGRILDGLLGVVIYKILFLDVCIAQRIAINFPTDGAPTALTIGSSCKRISGEDGICLPVTKCPIFDGNTLIRGSENGQFCPDSSILMCCPAKQKIAEEKDIEAPDGINSICGKPWYDDGFTDLTQIYKGNETATALTEQGYKVKVLEVVFDAIKILQYNNGKKSKTLHFQPIPPPPPVAGGIDARRVLTGYMALLGNEDRWFCDGVLINNGWVLTAAHCFDEEPVTIIRLGEYNISDGTPRRNEYPLDFAVKRIVLQEDYFFPSKHHDLALVQLDGTIPKLREDLFPVCLPWGKDALKDIVGQVVTLTGWGASYYLGPSTPVLQEANVTVFDPSVCDKSYSTLRNYKDNFPQGITKETSVCAGTEAGGIDACQGDSGGPIIYGDSLGNRFTLAGIVSAGNGCGLAEFPGIYIPLHNPKYLAWIKQTAFQGDYL